MKIEIHQSDLKLALSYIQKAVPTKPQLPILSFVLLTASDEGIQLSATDLYLGIRTKISGKISEPGRIAISGEMFRQIINSLPAGEIQISTTDKTVQIVQNKSRSSLPFQAGEDFPVFPEVKGENINLSLNQIEEITQHIGFAASLDQTRPVLTSISFSKSDQGLEIAATDGFRLAVLTLEGEKLDKNFTPALIPAKAFGEILRIASSEKISNIVWTISREQKQALFQVGDTELFIRTIEGEYPPYHQIIPHEFKFSLDLDVEEIWMHLKRAMIFTKDVSNIVRIRLSQNSLEVYAVSPTLGEYSGSFGVNFDVAEKIEIAFNANYINDLFMAHKPKNVLLQFNEPLKPVLFTFDHDNHYKYIVMPFRVIV